MMKVLILTLTYFFIFSWISIAPVDAKEAVQFSGNTVVASAKSDQESPPKGNSKDESAKAIDKFEKEKLAHMKKYIGKRFMAVRTARPPEFFESPDNLNKKIAVREKEEFLVIDVVQNKSGTMNFYRVRLESGRVGYLAADGSNLEIRVKDGSILSVTKRLGKKKSVSVTSEKASKAVEDVKNHLIPSDPVSKDKRSLERRMIEVKATSSPNLRWRYEAKEIGTNKFRVTQYAEGESNQTIVRTWIVDLSTAKVSPENIAAKQLYR
jgi:hypothetical protein